MKDKSLKYKCEKCGRGFGTARGLASHGKAHPYVPPPRRTTETIKPQLLESHSLLNGRKLELGDVFYRIEKHVIKSITYTEGTDTVEVQSEKLRQNWQVNQPQ